jgi:hypothetical protein
LGLDVSLLLRVGTIGQSKRNGRKASTLLGAARHNAREIATELEGRGRIDGARVHLNYSMAGPADAEGVVALARKLMADIGVSAAKLRRDYVQAVELIFHLPNDAPIDPAPYFAKCLAWVVGRYGSDAVLCAHVHLDEGLRHCHVLLIPIQAGQWVGGSMLSLVNTAAMRDSFGKEVAKPFGLKEIGDRMTGRRKSDAVAMVLAAIQESHGVLLLSPLWQPIHDAIKSGPEPFLAALGLDVASVQAAKMRTSAEIFTSKGKGPANERNDYHQKPKARFRDQAVPQHAPKDLGFDLDRPEAKDVTRQVPETLTVGFPPLPPPFQPRFKSVRDRVDAIDKTRGHDGAIFPDDIGHTVTDEGGITRERDHQPEQTHHDDEPHAEDAIDPWSPVHAHLATDELRLESFGHKMSALVCLKAIAVSKTIYSQRGRMA